MLTRRSFLGLSLLAVAGLTTTPVQADPLTSREYPGFQWPIDVKGGEAFWGQDILFTIDDCHLREYVRDVLDSFTSRDLRATLFPNSNYLPLDDPETKALWHDIIQAGFEIGYHTTNHNLDWSRHGLEADFATFTAHMRDLLDLPDFAVRFVRAPYGNWTSTWLEWAAVNGLTNVRWNFVPDANLNTIEDYKETITYPNGGRIVLMHPREWDSWWLETHLDDFVTFAAEVNGRITTLSGTPAFG